MDIPEGALAGGVEKALANGRYERIEADAVEAHLRPGDRFLDLGAGLGFLCGLAARVLGPDAVSGVEAGPETVELARANLALNGFGGVRLRHGAVTGGTQEAPVSFGLRPAFWASALRHGTERSGPKTTVVTVPGLPAARLLAEEAPTVLSCDIEGAELEVLTGPLPASLRLIVVEIHPVAFGDAGTRRIFDALSAQGFAYRPEGSRGQVVVFGRDS